MKTRNIILLIILLVLLDQVTKLIIYHSFMDVHIELIPHVVDFKPFFNSKYSYVNDSLYLNRGIDLGLLFHVILFAIIWLVVFVGYRFYKSVDPRSKILDVSIALLTAGVICAYLGILVWDKGVLDFMHFKWMINVICDFKDLYVNGYVVLFIIGAMTIDRKYNLKLADLGNYLKGLLQRPFLSK